MLRFPCLVLDHDNTVVQSEDTVNYPCFCQSLLEFRPGQSISLEEYTHGCYHLGFIELCKQRFQFTDEELDKEYQDWKMYIRHHIPEPYPGMADFIRKYKAEGGILCVVSHSSCEIILRDYRMHMNLEPDDIFGWEFPEHQRKPSPYPLLRIMEKYNLSPSQLFVLDDMKPACEMARAAGVQIGFASWGRKLYPEIQKEMRSLCDYSFEDVNDFSDFIFS